MGFGWLESKLESMAVFTSRRGCAPEDNREKHTFGGRHVPDTAEVRE
jgi:hypothetical protein